MDPVYRAVVHQALAKLYSACVDLELTADHIREQADSPQADSDATDMENIQEDLEDLIDRLREFS